MDKKIRVGLVQIGESFGGQYYLPYSVGVLQSYAQRHLTTPDTYKFMTPIYKQCPASQAAKRLSNADIICFSAYSWNFKTSLDISTAIKSRRKNALILFGGPQIPEDKNSLISFLKKYGFIDIACYGEGEIPFLKVLENMPERDWHSVPSIGYRDGRGRIHYNPPHRRIEELNEIPSPYLEHAFDALMAKNPDTTWSAMWETNRGCPFSCAFCAWGSKNKSRVYHFGFDRLRKEADWFSKKKIEFVFCCDANFGMFPRDGRIVRKIAENKKNTGYPKAFSVQNTKNSTQSVFEVEKALSQAGLQKGVNLALQSTNPETLMCIGRKNIEMSAYKKLQKMFAEEDIATFTDIIVGLPKETYETFSCGVSRLIDNGQHNKIQFIILAILENTAMANPAYQRRYGLKLKECSIVSHHSRIADSRATKETQELVIATADMPKPHWIRAMAFSWMSQFIYFDKTLQITLSILNRQYSLEYRSMIEAFMIDSPEYPWINKIHSFFKNKAIEIQQGGYQYVPSKEWLGIWWPVDEYMFIELCRNKGLSSFYDEAETLLSGLLSGRGVKYDKDLLHESITLNGALIKLPFINKNSGFTSRYNIYETYKNILVGNTAPLKKVMSKYVIRRDNQTWGSWEEWLKDVVWYGSKRATYLHDCCSSGEENS